VSRIALPALLGFAALIAPRGAVAHEAGTSYLHIEAPRTDSAVTLRWQLAIHDIIWSVHMDGDYDGVVTASEIRVARAQIEASVRSQLSVERGDAVCKLRLSDAALATRDSQPLLSVTLAADCPRAGLLKIGGHLFMGGSFMPGRDAQRVLLSARRGDDALTGVISAPAPVWSEPQRPSGWREFTRFIGEGVWHVLIGYDHIAFLLLLLLPAVLKSVDGRWRSAARFGDVLRDIVLVVTAFTIAHSATLALAVTGTVQPPSQPIEVAIAASIAVAGVINLVPRLSGLRLPLAFGFGLVHGFGFANALRGLDAAGSQLLPLLAGFNLGVELAQLAIVATVLPLIFYARGSRWYAAGVLPLGSCALGAAGIVWLLQRI
jgi:hypothetical protein